LQDYLSNSRPLALGKCEKEMKELFDFSFILVCAANCCCALGDNNSCTTNNCTSTWTKMPYGEKREEGEGREEEGGEDLVFLL
jgi:hypothetical protein